MRKFIRTIKNLSEQAAQFQEALQKVPPKVAQIREAVTMTAGQLRQLQADVQMNVTNLKTDGQDRLVEVLHEVNGSVEVFNEAGYELGQVEMELSPVPRLMVHLNRVGDVHSSILRSLAAANSGRKFTHSLLTAVMQAESMADEVDIQGQVYYKLIVHIGPVPAVRLCWMPEVEESVVAASTPTVVQSQPAPAVASATASDAYGKGSFFGNESHAAEAPPEETSPAEAEAVKEEEPVATPVAASAPTPAPVAPATSGRSKPYRSGGRDWGASSLERFKKMPSISKYGG